MVPVQRKMHCKMFDKFPREHDQQINPLLNLQRTSQDRSPTTLAIVGHKIQEAEKNVLPNVIHHLYDPMSAKAGTCVNNQKKEMVF